MPIAYEMRVAAWRRMKEGGLLPVIAGFALVFLLGKMADTVISQIGTSQGWVENFSLLEAFVRQGVVAQQELKLTPQQEEVLGSIIIPQMTPAYQAAVIAVTAFWEGILAFGCSVLAIAVMRGGATAFQALSGFRWPFRTASLGFLRTLLVFLWSLLLVVPGVFAAYSYRMAFFLLADHPDWSPWKAIAESKSLMYGHRWRLFCLDLSFLGWFMLVFATCGLAGIFVIPYHATATAAFYEDLLDRTER